ERTQVTREQPVRPWWKETADGGAVMSIKRGFTPIAFEGGKTGIAVESKDQLPALIDELRQAVLAGEMDFALAPRSKRPGTTKSRETVKLTAVEAATQKKKQPVTA